jgi:hypothetical protein
MKKDEKKVASHLKHDIKEAKKSIKDDKSLIKTIKPKGK